jgi:Cu(I)/Ag(I) efflux system membrane fusion protein
MMKKYFLYLSFPIAAFLFSCKEKKNETVTQEEVKTEIYTCPMHPQIIRDKPGNCPICGMELVKKEMNGQQVTIIDLNHLLKPTNSFVVSSIPVTTLQQGEPEIEIDALGNVAYDTKEVGTISTRVSGRIEKLYVRYRYQKISKGQKVLDIYSPELLTDQQNLLFLLKNDPQNVSLISASKQRLSFLGLSPRQIEQIIKDQKPSLYMTVYSNYSGHIHEAGTGSPMSIQQGTMTDVGNITEELSIKEGMYIQKGQNVFSVYDPNRAWALLNIYADMQSLVKVGNAVRITPETAPSRNFRAAIQFIEPFYRKDSKTLTVRVPFNNSSLQIPVGSQVKGTIFGNSKNAAWLPKESVVSLGFDKVVFLKDDGGFRAHKVETGFDYKNKIQIISGLNMQDSVAVNAQFLMDSESFIKLNR